MDRTSSRPTDAEIAVLEALAAQGEVLSAGDASGVTGFRTTLRFVDPLRQFLIFARSGDAAADAMFTALARADFLVEWGEWRVAFAAESPETVSHEGVAAIRLRFPESVVISRRRMFERSAVPDRSLRCVAYSGAVAVFEAVVTDISQGGVGLRIDDAGDALEPGMVLPRCRILRGEGDPATVDLEVRHTAVIRGDDGRRTVRAGCRFVNLSPSAMALVAEFAAAR